MDWFRRALLNRLHGKHIHIEPIEALKKINCTDSVKIPFRGGRSVGELLFHINWWQDFSLGLINGIISEYIDGVDWSTGNVDWSELVERFTLGFNELKEIVENRVLDDIVEVSDGIVTTVGAEVLGISQHTSYHLGQVVYVCHALDIW